MAHNKSLDEFKIIAALLHDIHNVHGVVFNTRALRLTLQKVNRRVAKEGLGFLTKTLPKLGKAFDKALTGAYQLNSKDLRFTPQVDSVLPRFLGEFFSRVLDKQGCVLSTPCVDSVIVIRQVCYLFYKYELPYTDEQEQAVIQRFKRTEDDISTHSAFLERHAQDVQFRCFSGSRRHKTADQIEITRDARILLSRLFAHFDPKDIRPRHGPGAVATKQRLSEKYRWSNISSNITRMYPADEYYYSSLSHVCDRLQEFNSCDSKDLPARVILVPKDSRGPRLISCEPVDYQWIQQGLGKAIVDLVEHHELTMFNVHFTAQQPNRFGALLGSAGGHYSTLDLNEASDRVSVALVRLLFPAHICEYLEACRSSSTELPDGSLLKLAKFAPMGSSLCFPILALTVWAILTAAAPDADTREGILVYGDDVVVPTAFAGEAMKQLELYGLKINRDKSCTSGFFRESCGMDAFKGIDVTPVRLRTVWSSSRSPEVYTSWIAYANSFYDKRYFRVYQLIAENLLTVYKSIPDKDMGLTCPSLREVPLESRPNKLRWNKDFHKFEFHVWDVKSPTVTQEIDGWSMLLRYFVEGSGPSIESPVGCPHVASISLSDKPAFRVRQYTKRSTSMLVKRWR